MIVQNSVYLWWKVNNKIRKNGAPDFIPLNIPPHLKKY